MLVRHKFCCILAVSLALMSNTTFADWLDDIGWRALVLQEGGSLEDGSDIVVSIVEAPTTGGSYMPNLGNGQLSGKTITDLSGLNTGNSNHALKVNQNFFGNSLSTAPGVDEIFVYEANDWINNITGIATNTDPAAQPYQVQNHSWIGNTNNNGTSTDILERLDFIVNRDNMTVCVGTANDNSIPHLLIQSYNTITVGKLLGTHGNGLTTLYGAGRIKPEIVVPQTTHGNLTSFATPVVCSAAAVLREAGGGANGVQTNATQNETIKALLLAGATKEQSPNWDRTTTRPLDDIRGAGRINILHSYNILAGGEFDGTSAAPGVAAGEFGWDYSESINLEKFYTFNVPERAGDFSVILTWNIDVVDTNPGAAFNAVTTLANMDLELTDSGGNLIDESVSTVDNIEHIYIRSLDPGQYTLKVTSDTNQDYSLAWRMTPVPDAAVDSFVASGTIINGGLAAIQDSDNQKLTVATGTPSQTVDFKSVSPTETPIVFRFSIETSVRSAITVNQEIYLFDYDADQFELVDTRPARVLGDEVVEVAPSGDLTRFVQPGTGCIEARVRFSKTGLARGIRAFIDHAYWSVL